MILAALLIVLTLIFVTYLEPYVVKEENSRRENEVLSKTTKTLIQIKGRSIMLLLIQMK